MTHLPPIAAAFAPLDDARMVGARKTAQTPSSTSQIDMTQPTLGHVAVSFAFDNVKKTLQVVITDEQSGQVVRQFEYRRLTPDVHQSQQLNGLLLNQLV